MIKLRLRASEVRLGDRLVGIEAQPHRIVVQVRRMALEVWLSHGGADETILLLQFTSRPTGKGTLALCWSRTRSASGLRVIFK